MAWRNEGVAADEVLACLRAPALAEIWTKPEAFAQVEVWRERAFEVVLDGTWVTGVFDRVVVGRDEMGLATMVALYDFKTDRGANRDLLRAAERHAGQLALYRRVVATLTGLPVEAVSAEIVFTESARKVALGTGA
jgi:hypothetical protein